MYNVSITSSVLPTQDLSLLSPNARRVLDLFRWYWRKLGGCWPKQRFIAAKIGKSVETVRRAVKELLLSGLIKIFHHGPRGATYSEPEQVPISAQLDLDFDRDFDRDSEPVSIYTELKPEVTPEPARKPPPEPATPKRPALPVGFDEQFQGYIGLFVAGQKPLSRVDIVRAHAVWIGLELSDRTAAVADAEYTIKRCKVPRYIPFPSNHLLSQAWTRTAIAERQIEYIDPRAEESRKKQDSILDRFLGLRRSA